MTVMMMVTMITTTTMKTMTVTTTMNNNTVQSGGSHHEHVCVAVCEGAEVGHGVLDERPEDEAEADSQVNVDGLDEAVGVGQ